MRNFSYSTEALNLRFIYNTLNIVFFNKIIQNDHFLFIFVEENVLIGIMNLKSFVSEPLQQKHPSLLKYLTILNTSILKLNYTKY